MTAAQQPSLFAVPAPSRLEVHSHSYVSGPRANGGCYGADGQWMTSTFEHSHEGGHECHQHPDCGPASYTIDRDEWRRTTGMRGGGQKRFTATPSGDQLPIVECEDWQKSFDVIIVGDPMPEIGTGPGIALPERIAQSGKLSYRIIDARRGRS